MKSLLLPQRTSFKVKAFTPLPRRIVEKVKPIPLDEKFPEDDKSVQFSAGRNR
jgi:hypothetical protein